MRKMGIGLLAAVVLATTLWWTTNVAAQINFGVGRPSSFGNYGPYVTRPFNYGPSMYGSTPWYGSGYNTQPYYTVLPGSYPSLYYNSPYYRPPVDLYGASSYPSFSSSLYPGNTSYYSYSGGGGTSTKSSLLYYSPISDPSKASKNSKESTSQVTVKIPNAAAEVIFAGVKTKQQGLVREFVTPPLEPGKKFHYDVVARWTEKGETVEHKRKVSFTAGESVVIDFNQAE